ncbi:hypothetical protein [Paraburkholderia bannensis]|uniref:hypothetical protein n=1 Tax=Paraburkholderia bannensis TaxID=765414 RepID=UPI002AAFE57E|nr:hypothetical protein [Paraburkholderia bannensis]
MNKENARQPKPASANEQRNFTLRYTSRNLRAVHAHSVRSQAPEKIARISGCPNGLGLIAPPRAKGLHLPCVRKARLDCGCDDLRAERCVDHLSSPDRERIARPPRTRAKGGV